MVAKHEVSEPVRRILLEQNQASLVTELLARLREGSCKTDSSKVVNQIVAIFFQKYAEQEYGNIAEAFFDKRGYLRNLINNASIEDIDVSIKEYLHRSKTTKTKNLTVPKNGTKIIRR